VGKWEYPQDGPRLVVHQLLDDEREAAPGSVGVWKAHQERHQHVEGGASLNQ
jgi:hypothetical protein